MSHQKESATTHIADDLIAAVGSALASAKGFALDGLPAHDGDLVAAEGIRNLTRIIAGAQLVSVENDPRFPYLVKTVSVQRRTVLPGADTVYHSAVLHGDYEYRLSGNRGTAHIFEIEVWKGHLSDLTQFKYHSSLDTFSAGPGEEIDLWISRTPKAGDGVLLPEGECTFLIRQYYYDWHNEQPAMLAIERVGAVYPPPPLSAEDIVARVHRMADMVRTHPMAARRGVDQHLAANLNEMHLAPVNIGFVKLRYMHGQYLCAADEAIILEVRPPIAKFWNFQLYNLQWEAIDYHLRQTSINGHQAHLNSDGMFRAVISQQDPGIANWLDTSGRTFGLLSARYYLPESLPIPVLKKVRFDAIAQHLPPDMARVTPAERQEAIRRRMLSTVRRLCAD